MASGQYLQCLLTGLCKSVFDIPHVSAELADILDKYVVVPADKISTNIMFARKTHYIKWLREELF